MFVVNLITAKFVQKMWKWVEAMNVLGDSNNKKVEK
jgi:hypothetical protein